MENVRERLLVITGPTASGKTALAVEIALRMGGEIVSADSMQIYRHMDIGTAKPTEEERKGVPHHMIDAYSPKDRVTVSEYREKAVDAIRDIVKREKTPILCGGTGLYIDALTRPMRLGAPENETLRDELRAVACEEDGRNRLYDMLFAVDPDAARKFGANDVRRVIRAIENYRATGKTLAERSAEDAKRVPEFDSRIYALEWQREELYARINARVDGMFRQGLIAEVRRLIDEGISPEDTAMQAIGYKEIACALSGGMSLNDARLEIQRATRNYAKRQMTWLRRDARVRWLTASGRDLETLADEILDDFRKCDGGDEPKIRGGRTTVS